MFDFLESTDIKTLEPGQAEQLKRDIYAMLMLTAGNGAVNTLIDMEGDELTEDEVAGSVESFKSVHDGYMVFIGDAESLDSLIAKGHREDEEEMALTVFTVSDDGESVVEFEWLTGEVKVLVGDYKLAHENIQDLTLAF